MWMEVSAKDILPRKELWRNDEKGILLRSYSPPIFVPFYMFVKVLIFFIQHDLSILYVIWVCIEHQLIISVKVNGRFAII